MHPLSCITICITLAPCIAPHYSADSAFLCGLSPYTCLNASVNAGVYVHKQQDGVGIFYNKKENIPRIPMRFSAIADTLRTHL